MAKKNGLLPGTSSWMRLIWNFVCCPVGSSGIGIKETRKPVAFGLVVLFCIYFVLDLYLFLLIDSAPPGAFLPITTNQSTSPCTTSPFCVLSSKGLFLGPTDFYVQKPLSLLANRAFSIDSIASANFISGAHIVAAMISARLVSSDSLTVRRMGVLVYEIRNYLDSIDGVVAKEEHKRRGEMHLFSQPTGAWGYFVDGVSDGVGCICLLAACLIYLQRHAHQRKIQQKIYTPLSVVSVSSLPVCNSVYHKKSRKNEDNDSDTEAHVVAQKLGSGFSPCLYVRKCLSLFRITATGAPAFFFLNQLLLSALFWNRNIILYGRILEPSPHPSDPHGDDLRSIASEAIHSPLTWLIIFGWRICNPMFWTELLLLAIFFDKMSEYLRLLQFSGYFIILFVAAMSEVHRWAGIRHVAT